MKTLQKLPAACVATGVSFCLVLGLHAENRGGAGAGTGDESAQQQQEQEEYGLRQEIRQEMELYEVSEIHGLRVESRDGENLGTVESLAVDLAEDSPTFIVVESGGVLGIGADLKVVPVEAVEIIAEDGMTGARQIVRVNIEEAQWEQIPSYEREQIAQLCEIAQAQEIYQHYNIQWEERRAAQFGAPDREIRDEEPREQQQPEATEPQDQEEPIFGTRQQRETRTVTECRLTLTSDIEGVSIHDTRQQEVGSVNDMVFDVATGRVQYVLITPATGFFERTEEVYAIAPRTFRTITTEEVVLEITREELEQAETLTQTTLQQHAREEVTTREEQVFRYERDEMVFGRPDRQREEVEEEVTRPDETEEPQERRTPPPHAREPGPPPHAGEPGPPPHTPPHAREPGPVPPGPPPHAEDPGVPPHPPRDEDPEVEEEPEFGTPQQQPREPGAPRRAPDAERPRSPEASPDARQEEAQPRAGQPEFGTPRRETGDPAQRGPQEARPSDEVSPQEEEQQPQQSGAQRRPSPTRR